MAAKLVLKILFKWRGKAFPLGSTPRPFIPLRQEFLRGTQLQTSEDVLAPNDACAYAANFKMNLMYYSDEQAAA
jgi:hypothetical protein